MKCTIPEISWHNRDPVLSIDIQAGLNKSGNDEVFWRIATGGSDSHVLIWHLTINENSAAHVKCVADLERHQRAVNVVRFSPSKEILASGDDESAIVLWKQKEECDFFVNNEDNENKEQWSSWKILRGHIEDVYDISWSMDSNFLISGSVDNTAILWNIQKGRSTGILSDHKGFVQGVSWDPCNQYVCTISTDRQCRLIDIASKKTVQRVHKSRIPTPKDHPLQGKVVRLFHDDTFKSFFRRLTFSPDGTIIIVPSGVIEPQEATEKVTNATMIFSRHSLKEPVIILPSFDECTIAVRCCPIFFKLKKNGPPPMVELPYRIIFAVATQRSVIVYDTQQVAPIAIISNIHYTRLTDVAWSSDGQILIVSSTDGYCSIIYFQNGELGDIYTDTKIVKEQQTTNNLVETSELPKMDGKENENLKQVIVDIDNNAMDAEVLQTEKKIPKISNTKLEKNDEKPMISNNKQNNCKHKIEDVIMEETDDIKLIYEETNSEITAEVMKQTPPKPEVQLPLHRTPRRVNLITLSSPKNSKKKE